MTGVIVDGKPFVEVLADRFLLIVSEAEDGGVVYLPIDCFYNSSCPLGVSL